MAQTSYVHIKTEDADAEGDLNMADQHNNNNNGSSNPEGSGANDENSNGALVVASTADSTRAMAVPGMMGVPEGDPEIHAPPPPLPRKDKNLREFLAAMDEYAPIVSWVFLIPCVLPPVHGRERDSLWVDIINAIVDPRCGDRLLPRSVRSINKRCAIKTASCPRNAKVHFRRRDRCVPVQPHTFKHLWRKPRW